MNERCLADGWYYQVPPVGTIDQLVARAPIGIKNKADYVARELAEIESYLNDAKTRVASRSMSSEGYESLEEISQMDIVRLQSLGQAPYRLDFTQKLPKTRREQLFLPQLNAISVRANLYGVKPHDLQTVFDNIYVVDSETMDNLTFQEDGEARNEGAIAMTLPNRRLGMLQLGQA